MIEVIEIRLRGSGKIEYYNPRGMDLKIRDTVIVEIERGMDFGVVLAPVQVKPEAEIQQPLKAIIRSACREDFEKIRKNAEKADTAMITCIERVRDHKLPMKLIKSEYSFDRSQLVFFFSAEGRIDFRGLVKDLASIFKTRIELRQIGSRDETRMFGGLGPCGRALCCSTFLKEFQPVTIKMARDQNLSLNPSKISGACGRLMCCLAYENETYQLFRKKLPKPGQLLPFGNFEARVVDINVLKQQVLLSYRDPDSEEKRVEWIDWSDNAAEKSKEMKKEMVSHE